MGSNKKTNLKELTFIRLLAHLIQNELSHSIRWYHPFKYVQYKIIESNDYQIFKTFYILDKI